MTPMTHVASKATRICWIWAIVCGHVGILGLCCCWGHANLSALHYLGPWWCRSQAAAKGHGLSQDLSWFPWSLLPLRAVSIPNIWSATWGHVGDRGSSCNWVHTDLGGLHCHSGHGDIQAQPIVNSHVWVHGPAVAMVCVDVHGVFPEGAIGTMCVEIQEPCWAGPPSTGPGIAGPAPSWTLQQENWPHFSWENHTHSG